MTGKNSTMTVVAVMAILLTACSKQPPKCGDDETLDIIRKIILEQIDQFYALPSNHWMGGGDWFKGSKSLTDKEIKDNLKFETPQATGYDKDIKKYSCEVKLVAGGQWELPISYESLLDDKGQHLVNIDGAASSKLDYITSALIKGVKNSREAAMTPEQRQKAAEQEKVAAQAKEAKERTEALAQSVDWVVKEYKQILAAAGGDSGVAVEHLAEDIGLRCGTYGNPYDCVSLELAGQRIDQRVSETKHVPPSIFFAENQFKELVAKAFSKEQNTVNASQDHLSDWLLTATPEINKLVDAKLSQ